ncbi:uncharacterized protein LOC134542861 [Bacillus rossius redtenbacheri]|uniref:uncharacterized protein LOC134542861 n=1 Tax=Bacillus rossius redtenbacheri TaxID=93214 RepID=UPI002FDE78E1
MSSSASSSTLRPWAAVLLAVLLARAGGALKCFRCETGTDPRCRDHFEQSQHELFDCEETRYGHATMEAYCKKLVYAVDQYHLQQNDTIRACAWARPEDSDSICRESTPNNGYQLHCSICRADQCNGAPQLAASAAGLLLLPALVAVASGAARL